MRSPLDVFIKSMDTNYISTLIPELYTNNNTGYLSTSAAPCAIKSYACGPPVVTL